MQKVSSLLFSSFLLTGVATTSHAQGIASGFMTGKGHGSVVVSGTAERYTSAYLVPEKTDRIPAFQEVRVNSLNLYATYGFTDKIDAVVSLPYIQSKGYASGVAISDLASQRPPKASPTRGRACKTSRPCSSSSLFPAKSVATSSICWGRSASARR